MSRLFHCAQQSDLWVAARVGRITSTGFGAIMAPPTTRASVRKGVKMEAGSESLERVAYRKEKITERIYHEAVDHHVTKAMMEGVEREPISRMMYEADTQQIVETVGFALHPEWDWFGVSADGLVGALGGVELKNPTKMVHEDYHDDVMVMVDEYKWQCLGCLAVFPKRQWWDLVSFHPRAPDSYKLIQYRFMRSEWAEPIAVLQDESAKFNEKIEAEIQRRGLPPTVWTIMPPSEEQKRRDGVPVGMDNLNDPSWDFLDDNLAGVP